MSTFFRFCSKIQVIFFTVINSDFAFVKQLLVFTWFVVCKPGIFSFFLCTYLIKHISAYSSWTILFFFFFIYISGMFLFNEQLFAARQSLLLAKVQKWCFDTFTFSFFFTFLRQFCSFNLLNFFFSLKNFFCFFKKNSKKEFNSEKINALLLKKKKQESFLKKFYRSNS